MTQDVSLIELVTPAGGLATLRAAVEAEVDTVYLGLRSVINTCNFTGLNSTESDIRTSVESVHRRGRQVLSAINTFPQPGRTIERHMAIDVACILGADTVVLADPGLMAYACERCPNLWLHLSVRGSATHVNAIELMCERLGIHRAVLPRMLTLTEVERAIQQTSVQIEVLGFDSLCVMVEGRRLLLLYATGDSPSSKGVCSPAHAVRWVEHDGSLDARLDNIMIDQYVPGELAGYLMLREECFLIDGEVDHVFEESTSLNAFSLLPRLLAMGVSTVKIEGRRRSLVYVVQVMATLCAVLDVIQADPACFSVKPDRQTALVYHAEGAHITQGAFDRPWE